MKDLAVAILSVIFSAAGLAVAEKIRPESAASGTVLLTAAAASAASLVAYLYFARNGSDVPRGGRR